MCNILKGFIKDHQLRAVDPPLVGMLDRPLEVIADQLDPQLEAIVDPQVVVGPPWQGEGEAILGALSLA